MKEKIKTVYYCEYCNKHGLSRHMMERHEKLCTQNPDNHRPCFGCEHLDKKETQLFGNYYGGIEWERKVDLLYCSKKEMFLYTPYNEIKGNQYDLGDEINHPMPRECEYKK